LDTATQKQLLLDYYEPVKYQGVTMTSKGTTWRNSIKGKFPFSLGLSIDKHLESKGINLAIIFSKNNTSFLGFDLDGDTDLYDIIISSYILTNVIEEMGFIPLTYISGGKGLHVEVRLNKRMASDELKKLASIIKTLAEDRGCQHIDRVYPSNYAYRMFGCRHYKTNKFTDILKDGRTLSEYDSWNELQRYFTDGCQGNSLEKVDKALLKYRMVKPNIKIKQKKEPSDKGSIKEVQYSIKNLEQIHTKGLYNNYTRYLTSFQLGRYFKEVLHLTEGQARAEIEQWLSRHYKESSSYFGADAGAKIKSAYGKCVKETINNGMRGYANGKSIKATQTITFSKRKSLQYVDDLKITKPQKVALRYLIRTAEQYNSLTFYHSLEQLSKGFKISARTVPLWINKFIELGAIKVITKGRIIGEKNIATTYELTIPDNCYEVNDEPKILEQEPIKVLMLSENIDNVHYIKTKVHYYNNKYRVKALL